ncbi:MAG: DUF2225 domain-containing protein [Defluviitaleaceae bacterium]|nr:DUF2225 domain-containing protein [Defluviitaleaceae bacterium]
MYGILDHTKDLGLELELPPEVFATSFNTGPLEVEEKGDISAIGYPKDFACPVCRAKFQATVLRSTKLRLDHMEELFPVYKDVEPMCYDIMMCALCGYASFKDKFDKISDKMQDLLLEKLRPNYLNFMPATFPLEIDHMQAIEFYKYALLTACLKKTSFGEKAMLFIKMAWLYKALGDDENYLFHTKYAHQYLSQAFTTENFPIFGMSEGAVTYLLASFSMDLGDYTTALKFLSDVIVNKNLTARIRDLARDKKDKVQELRREQGISDDGHE